MQVPQDGHLQANSLISPRGVLAAAKRSAISEDTPWQPPSMEETKAFEDEMHLRAPEGGKFPLCASTTGRYCFLGGCGEQLDLWDEVSRADGAGGELCSGRKLLACPSGVCCVSLGLTHIYIYILVCALPELSMRP